MQGVISAISVSYYPVGAQVMTLVLPLGLFIVTMAAFYVVFSRPHTVPGRRPIRGARPVAPHPAAAPSIAAATGLPTATAAGGPEPLADRGTPPVVGAASGDATDQDATDQDDATAGEAGSGPAGTASAEGSEDQE